MYHDADTCSTRATVANARACETISGKERRAIYILIVESKRARTSELAEWFIRFFGPTASKEESHLPIRRGLDLQSGKMIYGPAFPRPIVLVGKDNRVDTQEILIASLIWKILIVQVRYCGL